MKRGYGAVLSLENSAGYQLAALQSPDPSSYSTGEAYSYVASYPADGDMTLRYTYEHYASDAAFEIDYTCDTGAVTLPAPGVDSATCLTLGAVGTYNMPLSAGERVRCLAIPCRGVVELDMDVLTDWPSSLNITVEGSDGTALEHISDTAGTGGRYASDGNMFVHVVLSVYPTRFHSAYFALAWGCNAAVPVLPAIGGGTSAPLTGAPETPVPTAPCVALEAPLHSTFEVSQCWTVQCKGTVHINVSLDVGYGRPVLTLHNADGYELMEIEGSAILPRHLVTSYPANGMLTLSSVTEYPKNWNFTFDWTCEAAPVPPPAPGIDSAECLTLAPVGTYRRVLSAIASHCFAVQCLGTLAVSLEVRPTSWTNVTFLDGTGREVFFANGTGGSMINTSRTYPAGGVFQMHVVHSTKWHDDVLLMSWACDAASPELPYAPRTAVPETRVPPTAVPIALCSDVGDSANGSFAFQASGDEELPTACWYLSCTGTLHTEFNLDLDSMGQVLTLENSYGYNLDTLTDARRYRASYPADGNMVVRFASWQYMTYSTTGSFSLNWTCEEAPVIPPAPGTNATHSLTLADSGTYSRSLGSFYGTSAYSVPGVNTFSWTVQCYGVLSVAAWLNFFEDWARVTMVDSTGKEVYSATGQPLTSDWSVPSSNMTADFANSGLFHITANNSGWFVPGVHLRFVFGWSCNGVVPTDIPAIYTPVPETALPSSVPDPTVTQAPQTETLGTQSPLTNTPVTQVPQIEAGETEAPLTHAPLTHAPLTHAPLTESPLSGIPLTESPLTGAPETEVPLTNAPDTNAPETSAPVTHAPVTESPPTPAPETQAPVTPAPDTKNPTSAPLPATGSPATEAPKAPLTSATETPAPTSPAAASSSPSAQPVPHTSLPAGALLPTPVPVEEADAPLLSTAALVVIAALGTCLLLAVAVAVFFCRQAQKGTPTQSESFYSTGLLPQDIEGEAVCLEDRYEQPTW